MSPLRQHHGPKARLEVRPSADVRAQLVAFAELDRRSLNAFTNMMLEEGLKVWLARRRREHPPVEPEEVGDLTPAHATTQVDRRALVAAAKQIEREYKHRMAGSPPKLPDDLTPKERAMLGMKPVSGDTPPAEDVVAPGPPDDLDDTAGMDPEVLSVIETLQGKRVYVPPGLR